MNAIRSFLRPGRDLSPGGTPLDHDGFGSNRSERMNVISSEESERDADGKPGAGFPHPARGHTRSRASGEEGFTLVEILVVITIIGLIMGLVGPRVLNYLGQSKEKAAAIQIESFSSSLDLFYLDNGRYPSTNEGLVALVKRPTGANAWNGPYIKGTIVPLDPWGRPYLYRSPGQHGAYDIASNGASGQDGGTNAAAAITNWQRKK